jgi:hypothetical protein
MLGDENVVLDCRQGCLRSQAVSRSDTMGARLHTIMKILYKSIGLWGYGSIGV